MKAIEEQTMGYKIQKQ